MLFMVIERFKDPAAVYQRFREKGRLLPAGLRYLDSWVETHANRCFQLMETDNPTLLQTWMTHWQDLVDFEIAEVASSREAAAQYTTG